MEANVQGDPTEPKKVLNLFLWQEKLITNKYSRPNERCLFVHFRKGVKNENGVRNIFGLNIIQNSPQNPTSSVFWCGAAPTCSFVLTCWHTDLAYYNKLLVKLPDTYGMT